MAAFRIMLILALSAQVRTLAGFVLLQPNGCRHHDLGLSGFLRLSNMRFRHTTPPPPPASQSARRRTAGPLSCTAAETLNAAPVQAGTSPAAKTSFSSAKFIPQEEVTLEVIEGRVPDWLVGSYFRNGPGRFDAGTQELNHLFDGYSLISKFEFKGNNQVTWKARFLQTEAYAGAEEGKMKFNEFGTAAGEDALSKASAILRTVAGGITDNACVSIQRLDDGTLVALTESVRGTYEFDAHSLETLRRITWEGDNKADINTAHPLPDGAGGYYNLATVVGPINAYAVVHTPRGTRRRDRIATIPAPFPPCWHHAFALTARHVVVIETPTPYNLGALLGLGPVARAAHVAVDWDPSRPVRIHVVSRATGQVVATREAPPFFFFHVANAFDQRFDQYDAVAVDVCAYADPTIVNDLTLATLLSGRGEVSQARLTRLTVPLGPGPARVDVRPVDDPAVTGLFNEFPAIHPDRLGRDYRYVWAAGCERPSRYGNVIIKTDLSESAAGGAGGGGAGGGGGGRAARWHEPGCIVGEPIMVPRPAAAGGGGGGGGAEDDGAVLTVVARADGRSELVILDAASLSPLCRLQLPAGLPYAFHGIFVPSESPAAAGR